MPNHRHGPASENLHISGKALAISGIGILQEQGSELLVRGQQLPDIVLDFKTGVNHGSIMRRPDECEKRELILETFAAKCLPQDLSCALRLRRLDEHQSGSCKYPVFGLAVRDRPVNRRFDGRQTLIDRIELAPPRWRRLEKLERLVNGLRRGLWIAR
jgi:hypothetical protein